ncbi:hypothetical protein Noda2021_11560 [Candidatus Dependentiae bacterium Noda2021]|nr:hypothetical protein Noda2021_11560 [Candidatus Dependentiae bacterium Noda2021]
MKEPHKNHHEGKIPEDVISFDRCRSLHKRKENELRSRALVASLLTGLFGFWLGYMYRDKTMHTCPIQGAIPATLSTPETEK